MTLTTENIIVAKCHVGNLKKETNPKTRRYWLDAQENMVIINPDSIKEQLENARKKFEEAKAQKKEILIICESPLYAEEIAALATKKGVHYMNQKIPSGFLTNFDTLISRIKAMNELKSFIDSDSFVSLTKKEQLTTKRKLKKIEEVYGGVKNLRKSPDLIIVIDGKSMVKFVDEVSKTRKDSIVLASTNFDRWIPENNLVITNVYSFSALDFSIKYILNS